MEKFENNIILIFEIIDGKEKFLEMINCCNDEELNEILNRLNSFEGRHFIVISLKHINKKYTNILKRDSEGIIKINKRKIKKYESE